MAIEEEEELGIPEWVVTFGDMMSLLLTFFIMLVSMSEVKEEEKFQAMVDSIQKQFGYDMATNSPVPGRAKPRNSDVAKLARVGREGRKNIMMGGNPVKAPAGDHPRVLIANAAGNPVIGAVIFFEENSAELSPQNKNDLESTIDGLLGKPQKIEIRGHTSRRPVDPKSGYADHWELAFQRCTNSMQYLVEKGIESKRIRMSVAGPNEPLKAGHNLGNLGRDARVEVYLIDEVIPQSEGYPVSR